MSWDRRFSTTWACFKRLFQIRMLLAHMMFHTLHWLCWKPSSRRKLPRRPSTSCGTSWKRQPRFWEKTLKLETSQLLRFADGKFAICLNGLMCSVYLFFWFVDIFPMSHIPWYFILPYLLIFYHCLFNLQDLKAPMLKHEVTGKLPLSSLSIRCPDDGLPSLNDWLTTTVSFLFSGSRLFWEPLDVNINDADKAMDDGAFTLKKGFTRLRLVCQTICPFVSFVFHLGFLMVCDSVLN